ncbi:MAG: coniferyl-aldehyde dehydrogenase [Candidatus Magnetoglobus multicellularis str. Araruama]|uniref:Aldehyde dehydrogenase n=1 Tax=Candidatus Magnetoglobus multicellularis str. Araruama TaxID=890399 RepID=A0A1V1NWR7_9BACT|nr:MAG: coniferyl-aldehyde dehydrogenase [Candidatus Magnetoglobus multicellularis str. Araruama]
MDNPSDQLHEIFEGQRRAFLKYGPPTLGSRKIALTQLEEQIVLYKNEIAQAISSDFGHRSYHETLMAEIFVTIKSIQHTKKYLNKWMKPQKRPVPWYCKPAVAKIHYQPLGVVGIMSPWNYPFQLCFGPMIAALGAGNRVMVKPSGRMPETCKITDKIISKVFEPHEVAVVSGPQVNDIFIQLPFNHLLYTGSTKVGKKVMRAASENLTPVTLELGGCSPVIVAEDFPIQKAVNSILTGKLFNAGQTCIAANHAFIHKTQVDSFVTHAIKVIQKMYPTALDNADYSNIISKERYDRLRLMIEDARNKGATVYQPHEKELLQSEKRKILPTLIINTSPDMMIMQEEIFGPILPVVAYESFYDVIENINHNPRPLALYCFTENQEIMETILRSTISGGVCMNDTLLHFIQDDLPFGGVGHSGMGRYHGFHGFETFSNSKGVFYQSRSSIMGVLRPPYGRLFKTVMDFFIG